MKRCLILIFLTAIIFLQGKELTYQFTEYFSPQFSPIILTNQNLIHYAEKMTSDSLIFVRDVDYEIDYKQGIISPLSPSFKNQQQVKVEYLIIPQDFLEPLFLYRIELLPDSTYSVKKRESKTLFLENNKLLINGSKTFAISFSDKKDFDINQSLYLKLSGEIASNLFVEAQLSDSNSPISVEGSSRELSSLDRVFISLFNDNFELSFGDLAHEITNTSYINYLSQFDGLKLGLYQNNNRQYSGNFAIQNNVWAALAVSQGKNSSYRFTCIEGKQGPYYIHISDSSEFLAIIANSEVVFIDGIKANRGIDYFVDYSEGSVSFEKLVTSETEIYITFEYSDEKYRNNLYLTSTSYKITDYLNIDFNAILRADDSDNPLEDIHTEEDLLAFKEAGDSLVYANGIYEVEVGSGNYIATLNAEGETIYSYVGLGKDGDYNIYFSFVGAGLGSYNEYKPNKYEFVGEGNGDYEPIRKLVSPQRLSNYDLVVRFGLESIYLEMETLLSDYDKNTLSGREDSDNQGNISKLSLNLNHEEEAWLTTNHLSYEHKTKYLSTFADLADPLELSYGGLATAYDSLKSESRLVNSNLNLKKYLQLSFLYKEQKIYSFLNSDMLTTNISLKEQRYSPRLSYQYISRDIDYDLAERDSYSYLNHYIQIEKKISSFRGKFELTKETSEDKFSETQKISYKYEKYKYSLQSQDFTNINFSSSYWHDQKRSLEEEIWQTKSTSQTSSNDLLLSFQNHNSNLEYTFRKIDSNDDAEEDNVFNMIKLNSTHSMFDNGWDVNYNYKINNLEFYPKVRELQYIGEGVGDYDSLGVYQNDGDYDFLYVNSGQPELSTELNFGINSYIRLSRFTDSFFWKNLSAEFRNIRTEDSKTTDKLKLYFLNPSVLMDSETTLYGRNNTQTSLFFNSDNRKFNYTFSLEWDDVLDNRYQSANKTKIWIIDNELMLRRLKYGNVGTQFTYREEADTRYNFAVNDYSTSLKYQNNFLQNYLYNGNLKFKLEEGKKTTNAKSERAGNAADYKLKVTSLNNIITANLNNKYLIQFNNDLIYTLRDASSSFILIPEKRAGLSTKWNVSAKYSYNQFVTVNLSYFGNKYPQNQLENNLNIEIKAEF